VRAARVGWLLKGIAALRNGARLKGGPGFGARSTAVRFFFQWPPVARFEIRHNADHPERIARRAQVRGAQVRGTRCHLKNGRNLDIPRAFLFPQCHAGIPAIPTASMAPGPSTAFRPPATLAPLRDDSRCGYFALPSKGFSLQKSRECAIMARMLPKGRLWPKKTVFLATEAIRVIPT